jgi:hypothetical protein
MGKITRWKEHFADQSHREHGDAGDYAATLWSYIHRAQPFDEPGALMPDQVNAVTAYVRIATL